MSQSSFMPSGPEVGRRRGKKRKKTKKTHPVSLWMRSRVHDICNVTDELQWFRVGTYRNHEIAREVASQNLRRYAEIGSEVDTWIGDKPLEPCGCVECVLRQLEGPTYTLPGEGIKRRGKLW